MLLFTLATIITWALTIFIAYKEYQTAKPITLGDISFVVALLIAGLFPVINIFTAAVVTYHFFAEYGDIIIFKGRR